jgi:hypothetical protein
VTWLFCWDFNETGAFGETDPNGVAVIYTIVEVKKPSYEFCVNDVIKGAVDPIVWTA